MQLRNIVSTFALAACTLAPVTSQAASLFGRNAAGVPSNNAAVKAKMIKFTLKNKTSEPMTVIVNDQPMTLAANAESSVRVAEGSDIYSGDHTTVKVHVTNDLSGNTVSFR